MFSKALQCAVLIAVSATSLLSCGLRMGEKPSADQVYEFSGTACLSKAAPTVKEFVQGVAKDNDMKELWSCIGSAVDQFKKKVRGSTANQYSSQEIATFLETNFLDKKTKPKISPELQLEFMKIKQLFIGGDRNYVTRQELDKTAATFQVLRDVTVGLNPYMKILAMKWSASHFTSVQKDMAYFEEANLATQKSTRILAELFEKNGDGYELTDFVSLINELSKFYGEDWEFKDTIKKYMPVVQKIKKTLAGGDENIVTPTEWKRFALLGSRGYIQYLRYHYFIKSTEEAGSSYHLAYVARTVEDILSVFEDLTAQKPEGIVSKGEVTELLGALSNVWSEFKISEGLISETMKVKQLLFGGSNQAFTTSDFTTARLKVSRLKSLVERFMPYWAIYGRDWDQGLYSPDEAQRFFQDAQFILEATGRELGALVEGSYDIKDLSQLAREFEALYPPKNPEQSLTKLINKYSPLAIDVKKTILGGNDSIIQKSNWSVVLGFGARVYTDFLYYEYFLRDVTWDAGGPVADLSIMTNQSLNILRDLLQVKTDHKISRTELSLLGQDLIDLNILPEGVDQNAVDQLIKVAVNNILNDPKNRLAGVVPDALNATSVDVVRNEAQVWLDTEYFITKLSENWSPSQGLTSGELVNVLEKGLKVPENSSFLNEGLNELLLSVKDSTPLAIDSEGRLNISNRVQQIYTKKSLKQLNIDRALSRLAIHSFAGDLDRIKNYSGVTLDEVNFGFSELKIIFVKMGLLDPTNNSFGASRFRDANLFTPHANGDSLASYQEITDLVSMIWSGLNINSKLKDELLKDCLQGVQNPNSNTAVQTDCALKSYKNSMAKYMTATPEYLRYMKWANTNDEMDGYVLNVFKTAGYVPNSKKTARWGDLSLAPHIVQYIEMVFARFDKDKDGFITTPEALMAFPLFKGLLLEFAKDQIKKGSISEKDLPAIFCFMLHYGKPPETKIEKLVFWWNWLRKSSDDWDVRAGRGDLAKILGYVADKTAKAPIPEIPDIEKDLPPEAR